MKLKHPKHSNAILQEVVTCVPTLVLGCDWLQPDQPRLLIGGHLGTWGAAPHLGRTQYYTWTHTGSQLMNT